MNASIESALAAVEQKARTPGSDCAAVLAEAHRLCERHAAQTKARLLGSPLDWSDEERAEAATLAVIDQRLARAARALSEALARVGSSDDDAMCAALAMAFFYSGEHVKGQVASGAAPPIDYRGLHGLMRLALWRGIQRRPIELAIEGRALECTLEGLYFRALTLARFAAGPLSGKQIEIMDSWICMYLPVLEAVTEAPSKSALRADLDSDHGLRHGPRADAGESLYLPRDLVEQAHRTVVKALHRGRILPEGRITSTFRIEEHIAVLAQIRRGVRVVARERVVRSQRRASGAVVNMHVGLTEIMSRAFMAPPPKAGPALTLVGGDRQVATRRSDRDRDVLEGRLYEATRRTVTLLDESDTGFGIEGDAAACAHVSVGDLIAFRLAHDLPLVLCRVTRSVPAAGGKTRMGARRISNGARVVRALDGQGGDLRLLFLLGPDSTGRQDGFLVADAEFTRGKRIDVAAGEKSFRLALDRVRERGRGWVLAGFEVRGVGDAALPYYEVA